ncbi:MAG: SDR family oxidoreductase [Kofleriaceae bacterium]
MNDVILVTGASGRTSRLILAELARRERPVRALARDRASVAPHPLVKLFEGKLGDASTLGAALAGVDRALLISSPRGPMVRDQCAFIDAAKAAGVRHVIKLSGRETGFDFDELGFSGTRDHAEIERYLEASGLTWTQLRPCQFMQVYLDELPSIKAHQQLRRPMGDSRVSPVDLRDVAKAAARVLTTAGHEGRRYELTGPEALTLAEIAASISAAVGAHIPYIDYTPEEHVAGLRADGAPPPIVELLSSLWRERRKSRFSRVDLDAYRELEFRPTSFAEFARDHAASWKRDV